MQKTDLRLDVLIIIGLLIFVFSFFVGCSGNKADKTVASSDASASKTNKQTSDVVIDPAADSENKVNNNNYKGATIKIKENSPADTVKVFYERLREKKFRDAIVLTNLKPAVQGLTESELDELGVDFGFLAQSVPENMPINGEIVTGDKATVTVNIPDEKDPSIKMQEIKLRRENDTWTILLADEEGEKRVNKEGKNYFFTLRMDVHHKEARSMLVRINKAQMIYRMNNGGKFANLPTLVKKGYVPPDALGSITTGYKYDIALKEDNMLYTALATPAEYGKTGKLSFAYVVSRDKNPEFIAKDLRGKSLQN